VDGASGLVLHVASDSNLMRRSRRTLKATSSTERLTLPAVAAASTPGRASSLHSFGGLDSGSWLTRSTEQVYQDLQTQPTESFLARTEETRNRPHEPDSMVWMPPHMATHESDGIWWADADGCYMRRDATRRKNANDADGAWDPDPMLGDISAIEYGRPKREKPEVRPLLHGGGGRHKQPQGAPPARPPFHHVEGTRQLSEPKLSSTKHDAAIFFGTSHFFSPQTKIIPGVGILYEREGS
jgi:hypothetical protein